MSRFTYTDHFALKDYLTDKVETAISNLEDENNTMVLHHEFPNYNPGWCKEEFDWEDEEARNAIVEKVVDYLMSGLFYYYDEDENE